MPEKSVPTLRAAARGRFGGGSAAGAGAVAGVAAMPPATAAPVELATARVACAGGATDDAAAGADPSAKVVLARSALAGARPSRHDDT